MKTLKKALSLLLVLSLALCLAACGSSAGQQSSSPSSAPAASTPGSETAEPSQAAAGWKPERTVTFYLYSGAGGDTDTAMRALAAVWEQYFGVTFNVVNMTGGGGGLAANQVYGAPADGYTLFGMAEGVDTMNVLGAFDHPTSVWDIMLLFGGYGCLGVPADSPYNSVQDLIDAANAGENIRISCCSPGTIWHLKALQVNQATGCDFNILTYEGSNQAVVGLLSKESEVVVSSLGEQSENILAGKIKPLAILENNGATLDGYGDIPSITETVANWADLPVISQWNGVGLRADTPDEIKQAYEEAFLYAITTQDMEDVRVARKTNLIGKGYEESRKVVDVCDSAACWMLDELGLAAKSPEEFGIPKP